MSLGRPPLFIHSAITASLLKTFFRSNLVYVEEYDEKLVGDISCNNDYGWICLKL